MPDVPEYRYKLSRIDKLFVYQRGEEIMTYDGGWINRPATEENRDIALEILKGFPERLARPPLPELKADFERAAKRPICDEIREQADEKERPRVRQFRRNALESCRR